jgi:hypothetical protein
MITAEAWKMTQVMLDAGSVAPLAAFREPVEIHDADGRLIGYFHPAQTSNGSVPSPLSREELEERRRHRGGRPLAEILKDLQAK